MRNFAQLMHRLLEIHSYEKQRSPELIAEDERLMDCLQEKNRRRKLPHTEKLRQSVRVKERLRA